MPPVPPNPDPPIQRTFQEVCQHIHEGSFGRALALLKDCAEGGELSFQADFLRGVTYLGLGCESQALAAFEQVLAVEPDLPGARYQRGRIRLRREESRAAEEDFLVAHRGDPERGEYLRELAQARILLEDPSGVLEAACGALAQLPRDPDVHACIAWAEDMLGNRDAAIRRHLRALELDPTRTAEYYPLARAGAFDDAQGLERMLSNPKLTGVARAEVGYALGEVLHRAGNHDGAFRAWDAAAHSFPVVHNPELREAIIDTLIDVTTPEWFRTPAGGDPTEAPIFIVGVPRSGSSLVERVLGAHPSVHARGEQPAMSRLAVELGEVTGVGVGFPGGLKHLTAATESLLAERYLREVNPDPSASRFTDKAPANALALGLIARLFPNARVIHTRRDPRDVALSCFSTWFGPNRCRFSYDLGTIARYQAGHDLLMEHWRAHLPLPILDLDYEDFVRGGEGSLRALVEFTGLPWDPACAQFHETGPNCFTASSDQVRRPLNSRAIGRWRAYEEHLGGLIAPRAAEPRRAS